MEEKDFDTKMKDKTGSESLNYISLLSVVSAFAVVSLHANGCFWQFSTERYWVTANILECFWYFAVPVFFMISGATLLEYPKRYDLRTFFMKRVQKTLFPFLFWSLLMWGYRLYGCFRDGRAPDAAWLTFTGVWNGIWNTSFVGIYWFFIPLFACYLSMPLLAAVPEERKREIFTYLAGTAFLLHSVIPFLFSLFHLTLKWPFHVDAASGYLLYMLLGYLIKTLSPPQKRVLYAIYVLAVAGLFAHMCGTYVLSMEAGKIVKVYKGYLNVPCILYSVGVFLFFKEHADAIMRKFGRIVTWLTSYTFAIYLLHWPIMQEIVRFMDWNTHSIIYRVLGPFLICMMAIGITWVLRKFKFGYWILP